ncbi:uncharacterized protein L201_002456 [Kwoniella dendrophila CBS 6074]|uniref:Conserved oligomeric Golgi complex subunit 8 n=1 Tax=Kwoniella dendrophila CBS 6074 TaxID=1295534 RepID=A0AAX4JQ92_9TREE
MNQDDSLLESLKHQGNEAFLDTGSFDATEGTPLTLVDLLQSSSPDIDFANPSATQYVDQLLSLSLHELLRQPQLISAETSTVESDLTNLCFREYSTFISVHKCSSAVSSAFDDFSTSLNKLINDIPNLENECKTFSLETNKLQNIRNKIKLILENQDKLNDLLELPQLMETCVRNGYYQESLQLLNHSKSFILKYPNNNLITDLNKEVDLILQLMLNQLLNLLNESVKLPVLVKTINFLRKLNLLNELELSLFFIKSRYHNFKNHLLTIDKDKITEPIRYLRRYIDLFREHIYDIIAQFTAIFLENSQSSEDLEISAIHITSFANQAISDLVDLVSSYIPRISSDSGSMSSILVQLGYCAMSFSRVGLDFAPLISAPFSSTILSTFSQSLATASNDFSSILRDSAKSVLPPSQILVVAEHIPHIVSTSKSPPPLPPIDTISNFPPIATLINAYITTFNNLRLLAPLELHSQLGSIHSSSLLASTSVLLQYVIQATNFTDDPPMSPVKSRPGHARTPSAPRADLLRRNSEVLMTPEARANKRREAKRVCVASADVWCRMVVPFLIDKLNEGVFADIPKPQESKELNSKLEELERWVKDNGEGTEKAFIANGNGTQTPPLGSVSETVGDEPKTPPRRTQQLVSSPLTFGSPFRSTTGSLPSVPQLSMPTPKSAPVPHTPHSEGIDAVFDSPNSSTSAENGISISSIPEPANLRESDKETLENMETQLEAMDIGLSGEQAAVAVDVKHTANNHHHEKRKSEVLKGVKQEPPQTEQKSAIVETEQDSQQQAGSNDDATPTEPRMQSQESTAAPDSEDLTSNHEKSVTNNVEIAADPQISEQTIPADHGPSVPEAEATPEPKAGVEEKATEKSFDESTTSLDLSAKEVNDTTTSATGSSDTPSVTSNASTVMPDHVSAAPVFENQKEADPVDDVAEVPEKSLGITENAERSRSNQPEPVLENHAKAEPEGEQLADQPDNTTTQVVKGSIIKEAEIPPSPPTKGSQKDTMSGPPHLPTAATVNEPTPMSTTDTNPIHNASASATIDENKPILSEAETNESAHNIDDDDSRIADEEDSKPDGKPSSEPPITAASPPTSSGIDGSTAENTLNNTEDLQSTPTSAHPSRPPSPDGTTDPAPIAAPSTSGGTSKKKKKKKGKK